jgi:hypothetical protein
MRATEILKAIIISKTKLGIGITKKVTAASKYNAIPISDFLTEAAKSILISPFL